MKDIERELTTANKNLDKWQQKAIAYQNWQSSPKTQEMQKLAKLLSTPDNIERLDRISEGHKIYDCASYILKQLGESERETRCFQGKFYHIEERVKTITISRQNDSSILFTASDGREQGGIIEIERLNLTAQDIENLSSTVRYLKQEEKLNRQVKHKGFEIG